MQTLLSRELDKEKERSVLNNALAQADRLNQLVENILVATSIENSTYDVFPKPADLSALVTRLLATSAALSQEKHQLQTAIEPNIPAQLDELAVTSILENLLENAVKYAPEGSTITVSVNSTKGRPTLTVADEGPGIPAADQAQIFQKFFRGGDEETRTAKGTGLGLYIVKQLADRLEANVALTSDAGKGAIFAIRFQPPA